MIIFVAMELFVGISLICTIAEFLEKNPMRKTNGTFSCHPYIQYAPLAISTKSQCQVQVYVVRLAKT